MPVQCQQCDTRRVSTSARSTRRGRRRTASSCRLQLVHRLPLLRGGVPVSRPALQLDQAGGARRRDQSVQAYLSNRIRPQGVMEKCTFCLHRTRKGRLPACLEACPTGARVFGNLLDPESRDPLVLSEQACVRAQGGARHETQLLLLLRSSKANRLASGQRRRLDLGRRARVTASVIRVPAGASSARDRRQRLVLRLDDAADGGDARRRQRVGHAVATA
jgi:ferredoxin